jgi:hypothetical protein
MYMMSKCVLMCAAYPELLVRLYLVVVICILLRVQITKSVIVNFPPSPVLLPLFQSMYLLQGSFLSSSHHSYLPIKEHVVTDRLA